MIAFLVLIGLICWALNRNRRRQLRPTIGGRTDRDLQRLIADLRARGLAPGPTPTARHSARHLAALEQRPR
jgi:hypothetical protein